jgi:uncharacterized linocin/CFP29 family protein
MSDFGTPLTDGQWSRIRQIVHDEALRARVAASFLPLYGPLPAGATTATVNKLSYDEDLNRLVVDDESTIRLANVSVNVFVKNHMLADPEMEAARIMFERAAQIIARLEDAIIFAGEKDKFVQGAEGIPPIYKVGGEDNYVGLVSAACNANNPIPIEPVGMLGAATFTAVVSAINLLETNGYYKPYACVLSDTLYTSVYTPIPDSMVLPADSIPPVLNGPLLRSSTLNNYPRQDAAENQKQDARIPPKDSGRGIVVSLQGNPVEIVVAQDISVRYLQATEDGDHVFRVSQRFVLRVKDALAVALIQIKQS